MTDSSSYESHLFASISTYALNGYRCRRCRCHVRQLKSLYELSINYSEQKPRTPWQLEFCSNPACSMFVLIVRCTWKNMTNRWAYVCVDHVNSFKRPSLGDVSINSPKRREMRLPPLAVSIHKFYRVCNKHSRRVVISLNRNTKTVRNSCTESHGNEFHQTFVQLVTRCKGRAQLLYYLLPSTINNLCAWLRLFIAGILFPR